MFTGVGGARRRSRRGVSLVAVPAAVAVAGQRLSRPRGCSGPAGRPPAASAAMSPFVVSATGIGYEQHAYVWTGFGVWTQLWASMTLPLAWGLGWRAIRKGRGWFAAVALVSLTIALHFETGYLALLPLLVLWPLVAGRPLAADVRRGGGARRRRAARGGVGDRAAAGAARVGGDERGSARHAAGQRVRRGTGARLARLRPAARSRPAPSRDAVRRHRVRTGARALPPARRERAGAAGRTRGVPAAVVRADHVRIAGRRDPRQRRHLLPPLHDGHPARGAAAGRGRRRVVRLAWPGVRLAG